MLFQFRFLFLWMIYHNDLPCDLPGATSRRDHAPARLRADHPRTLRPGEGIGVKGPYHGGKGVPERALLVVKGRMRWRKGRVRLERATLRAQWTLWTVTTNRRSMFRRVSTKKTKMSPENWGLIAVVRGRGEGTGLGRSGPSPRRSLSCYPWS